ncbi:MAG: hypothetical protein AB1424_06460 [Thermodesulfobacteriota bacterium]
MGEKKPGFLELLNEKMSGGNQGPDPEIPKKFCVYCEKETATWAFCDQCGKLFWGRIAWDLACGGVCVWLALVMVLKVGAEFYEKVIAVLIGVAGLWVMTRIIRQLGQAYRFWKSRRSR